jgi:hypothetical protein
MSAPLEYSIYSMYSGIVKSSKLIPQDLRILTQHFDWNLHIGSRRRFGGGQLLCSTRRARVKSESRQLGQKHGKLSHGQKWVIAVHVFEYANDNSECVCYVYSHRVFEHSELRAANHYMYM